MQLLFLKSETNVDVLGNLRESLHVSLGLYACREQVNKDDRKKKKKHNWILVQAH